MVPAKGCQFSFLAFQVRGLQTAGIVSRLAVVRQPQELPTPLLGRSRQFRQGIDPIAVMGMDVQAAPHILRLYETGKLPLVRGFQLS